ncbi:hypothetical protein LTR17_006067 [Elasticomyces elasticus]|nr:hypothetical protein LTR17_006067 [Elasticomyces elasticus]
MPNKSQTSEKFILDITLIKSRMFSDAMSSNVGNTPEKETENGEQVVESEEEVVTCSPLLDLPAEIWSYICRPAAAQPGSIMLDANSMSRELFQSLVVQPPITRVCKSVREETISTFYSFTFVYTEETNGVEEPDGNLWAWFKCIRPQHGDYHPAGHVPNLTIHHISHNFAWYNDHLEKFGMALAHDGTNVWTQEPRSSKVVALTATEGCWCGKCYDERGQHCCCSGRD